MKLFDEVLLYLRYNGFAPMRKHLREKVSRKTLAQNYDINAIIDDGSPIQDDKILAGRSAKREKTFLAAVPLQLCSTKNTVIK